MTDWGVHIIDIVLWGMQAEAPRSVVASGGKFAYPDDDQETPDTMTALYEFDDFLMTWEHATGIELGPFQRAHGVAFVGNNGTLVVGPRGLGALPRGEAREPAAGRLQDARTASRGGEPGRAGGSTSTPKTSSPACGRASSAVCNADVASLAAVNAHLGNIAFRTGGKVVWDAKNQMFEGGPDSPANKMLRTPYRAPWMPPQV